MKERKVEGEIEGRDERLEGGRGAERWKREEGEMRDERERRGGNVGRKRGSGDWIEGREKKQMEDEGEQEVGTEQGQIRRIGERKKREECILQRQCERLGEAALKHGLSLMLICHQCPGEYSTGIWSGKFQHKISFIDSQAQMCIVYFLQILL